MKSRITLVTGGVRSGKSHYAEALARKEERVLYIATALAFDDEMRERIRLHLTRRPASWLTLEAYKDLDERLEALKDSFDCILLDCLTVMATNLIFDDPTFDCDTASEGEKARIQAEILRQVEKLCLWLKENNKSGILVTNEVGMGIVPENRLARYFRDVAGRVNQLAAAEADEAWLVCCGLPVKLKGEERPQ